MARSALVTAGRAPAALEWVRSLAGRGWTVYVADSYRYTMSAYSRYVTGVVRVPPPREEPERFRRAVHGLIKNLRLDLVVPTCEEVFYLADLHPAVFCSNLELLRRLHSKWTFLNCARGRGVEIPESSWCNARSELPEDLENLVFKLEYSRFGEGTTVGRAPTRYPCLAQQRLRGPELSGYGIALEGKLKAWSLYEPVHRIAGASGIFFRPRQQTAARNFAQALVEKLGYHGQIAFDFMQTVEGLFVLECNPRATSGVHLLSEGPAGVFDGEEPQQAPTDRYLGPATPLALSPGLFRDLPGAAEVVREPGDRRPLLGVAMHSLEAVWRSLRYRQSLKQAMTRDLEWDGEPLSIPGLEAEV